jgi:thymidylate synthase
MKQYIDLVKHVMDNGCLVENRTGIRTLSVPGATMRFDLQEGFPAITTRRLPFKSAIGELVGFLRASRSAADFRALGCKVWDQNANENAQWLSNPYRLGEDDLGALYGVQWRKWPAYKHIELDQPAQMADALSKGFRVIAEGQPEPGQKPFAVLFKEIDQVRECLDKIMFSPQDRRILFHGWNPADLDAIALPSCHLLYQFMCNEKTKEISLSLYIRSNDLGLGAPYNLSEGAALLSLLGHLTGYTPRFFSYTIGDAHIYENHLDMLREQITREPLPLPKLVISDRVPAFAQTGLYAPEWLDLIEPGDFSLEGYEHHAAMTAPMAI